MIDHNVMRLDVSVRDTLAMTVVESLEQLEDVVANINVVELGVQAPEVGVVDILKDEGGSFALQGTDTSQPHQPPQNNTGASRGGRPTPIARHHDESLWHGDSSCHT